MGFISQGADRSELLCIASYDKINRCVYVDLVDVESQILVASTGETPHVREVCRIHVWKDRLITASSDRLTIWRMNIPFDFTAAITELQVEKSRGLREFAEVCFVEDQMVVRKENEVEVWSCFSKNLISPKKSLRMDTVSCMCVNADLTVVSGLQGEKTRETVIEVFHSTRETEPTLHVVPQSRVSSMQILDSNHIAVLADDGIVYIVRLLSGSILGSTSIPNASRLAVTSFAVSGDMLLVTNGALEIEIFNTSVLVAEYEQFALSLGGEVPEVPFWQSAEAVTAPTLPDASSPVLHFCLPPTSDFTNRLLKYKQCLNLPENVHAFDFLASCTTEQDERFWESQLAGDSTSLFVMKSDRLHKRLLLHLTLLVTWSPRLRRAFLPKLVFPFVKLFGNSRVVCFELIAMFLQNFCQQWFDHESDAFAGTNLLLADPKLHALLPAPLLFEKLLTSLLTEFLPADAWLRWMDLLVFYVRNLGKDHFDPQLVVKFAVQLVLWKGRELNTKHSEAELTDWLQTVHLEIAPSDVDWLFKDCLGGEGDIGKKSATKVVYFSETSTQYPEFQ